MPLGRWFLSKPSSVAVASELLGTLLLVVVVNGAYIGKDTTNIEYAICHGLAYALLSLVFAHRSGGHLNPAVTLAQLITCRIGPFRFLGYVAAQVVGAIVGAAFLEALTGADQLRDLGVPAVSAEISNAEAMGFEFFGTLVVILAHFHMVNWHATPTGQPAEETGPLYFAFAVVSATCFAGRFSGAGLNPARIFGSAVISGAWKSHWVFWVGPGLAALLGSIIHVFMDELGGARPVRVLREETKEE